MCLQTVSYLSSYIHPSSMHKNLFNKNRCDRYDNCIDTHDIIADQIAFYTFKPVLQLCVNYRTHTKTVICNNMQTK